MGCTTRQRASARLETICAHLGAAAGWLGEVQDPHCPLKALSSQGTHHPLCLLDMLSQRHPAPQGSPVHALRSVHGRATLLAVAGPAFSYAAQTLHNPRQHPFWACVRQRMTYSRQVAVLP